MIVIYMIKNCVNGKVYIGSTGNITDRFNEHKRDLNNSIHHNEHLQNAWNKYGSNSFEFKTLMVCPDSERNHCEQMFIDLYDSQNREFGYNIKDADGKHLSEQTKKKISKSHKGKHHSEETKKKISKKTSGENNPCYGRTGENHPEWKNYGRIVKKGFSKNKQLYGVNFNSKTIKYSIDIFKLLDWFFEKYPNEDFEIPMEVLDNALLS